MTPPPADDPEGRIVRFPSRGSLLKRRAPPSSPVEDLSKYETTEPESAEDYRHRMIVNGLAALAVLLLCVAGFWIADTMAQMRKNQDCVLSGRRGCTPVDVPIQPR